MASSHLSALHRAALPLCCMAFLLPACTRPQPPPPAEQPPLMAGEARFHPMSPEQQQRLQAALAPFLSATAPVEVYFLAPQRRDNGTFDWCISPAAPQGVPKLIGSLSTPALQQLAEQRTTVEHGDTADYWQRLRLQSKGATLDIAICPAEEFGLHIDGCTPVRSRSTHKALWALMDKNFNIQSRFDIVVRD